MADINIQDLATLSPSALDGDYYGIVFESNGDTNKVVFEDAVAQANANNGCVCLQEATLTIASADVLQLNSTPLTIVAGILGTIIDPVSIVVSLDFNTTPYATESDLAFRHIGSSSKIAQETMLDAVSSVSGRFGLISNANADQYVSGAALEVYCPNADPTAGDSDVTVRVLYRVITL